MSHYYFQSSLFNDFARLQRQLNAAGSPFAVRPRTVRVSAFPLINIGTTDEFVEVLVMAPGVDPTRLDVSLDRRLLTISGTRLGRVSPGIPASVPNATENAAVAVPDGAFADVAVGGSGSQAESQANTGAPAGSATAADVARATRQERFTGSFKRVVRMPDDVDPERIEAKYVDGCLRIRIARQEAALPHVIAIQ